MFSYLTKTHLKTAIILWSLCVSVVTTYAAEDYHFVNQSGSTMQFQIEKSGAIIGRYVSALGCGIGKSRPLSGWRNGQAISFTVTFEECHSITTWIGNSEDLSEIETIWILARGNESWDMKLTGVSRFKRVLSIKN